MDWRNTVSAIVGRMVLHVHCCHAARHEPTDPAMIENSIPFNAMDRQSEREKKVPVETQHLES